MSDKVDQMHAALDRELSENGNVGKITPVGVCMYINVGRGCTNEVLKTIESHNFKVNNIVKANGRSFGAEGDICLDVSPKR